MILKKNTKKGSFPDVNKDGKVTKKDVLIAKGVIPNQKIARLEKKEANLVIRGKKAVDEGRERKVDRLLGRAAKVENRVIKAKKK